MKLIDCFMYFDEDLVLEIRLNTLYKKVDKFVIAEATRDHAGNKKNLILILIILKNLKIKLNTL